MGKVERPIKRTAEAVVKDIRRQTRRKFGSEERIRIVLEGLKGEESISGIWRKEGIAPALYYRWSKDFIEADKKRLNDDTERDINPGEVKDLKDESQNLKLVAQSKLLKSEDSKKACVV